MQVVTEALQQKDDNQCANRREKGTCGERETEKARLLLLLSCGRNQISVPRFLYAGGLVGCFVSLHSGWYSATMTRAEEREHDHIAARTRTDAVQHARIIVGLLGSLCVCLAVSYDLPVCASAHLKCLFLTFPTNDNRNSQTLHSTFLSITTIIVSAKTRLRGRPQQSRPHKRIRCCYRCRRCCSS